MLPSGEAEGNIRLRGTQNILLFRGFCEIVSDLLCTKYKREDTINKLKTVLSQNVLVSNKNAQLHTHAIA